MIQPITQQLKRFADDERAVSPVVGFVLIFALIMIVFTIYQAEVVPAQNAEVEFKHSQAVEGEMSRLNDAMQKAGTSGLPQSATVATGVQYPDRALAINPGAPAGSLSTGGTQTVTISGLSTPEGRYWDGSEKSFDTRLLTYQSSYNIYQGEPRIVFENGMTVKHFASGTPILQTEGSLLSEDGSQINLLLIDGKYQYSGSATSVTAKPVSTSTEHFNLDSSSGKVKIPTTLSADQWETILDGDPSDPGDTGKSHASFGGYSPGDPSTVTINLDSASETYELRLTKVSLDSGGDQSEHYITSESPTTQTLSLGEAATFTVTARDELGNPVPEADVTAAVDPDSGGTGTFDLSRTETASATTNENGQATFSFSPKSVTADPIKVDVTLDSGGGGPDLSKVTYTVEADTRQGFIDNGYQANVLIDSVDLNDDQLEIVFKNNRGKQVTATSVQLNGFLSKKNKPVDSATLGGTTIFFNEGPVALGSDEFIVPSSGTKTVTLDLNERPNGVGLLIIDVVFETPGTDGQTLTATYAVSVDNE